MKKINGKAVRCIWLAMDEEMLKNDGFMPVEYTQEELPFT